MPRRSPGRRSSPARVAPRVTRISAQAARTRAHPISAPKGRRGATSSSSCNTSATRRSSATTSCRSSVSTTSNSPSWPRSSSPPRARNRPAVRIFLGITGASGAPYAARLVEALAGADLELGICASSAGIEVLATELYGNPRLSRDETLTRLLEHARGGNVTDYEPNDWKAQYASGSAKVDAYVICPCSMGTLGTIASGAMSNLIHRAASVALKEERKLLVMPRETPLSLIHLRNMLATKEAGATVLFLTPGFDHGSETVDDLVNFIVARALDQLGIAIEVSKRWGL